MGQKLRDDKIGALSHNAGIITMTASNGNPAWLTIGGQQYKVTSSLSRTITTDVTLTANTRYQIYAVLVSGTVELRVSLNENSVGPNGFSVWKLVGSFYANGLSSVAFGAFVNIEGAPQTGDIEYLPTFQNLGTVVSIATFWRRRGDRLEGYGEWQNGTIVAATASFTIPANISTTLSDEFAIGDYGSQGSAGSGANLVWNAANSNVCFGTSNWLVFATGTQLATNGFTTVQLSLPVVGWSNTPIKDL